MNRRILLQVAAPALVLGLLLLAACVAGAWYSSRLQRNLTTIRHESAVSLQVAQELEIELRQLRHHCFLYLADPSATLRETVETDQRAFEVALGNAASAPRTQEEANCLRQIEDGYRVYRDEMADLRKEVELTGKPIAVRRLAEAHPLRHVVEYCHKLLGISQERMNQTFQESDRVSRQVRLALLLLGLGGPLGGLLCGFGFARGLSRSIYQLSVRVQGMAQRLDQDVASVSVAADGDLGHLDRQLGYVVRRVEEVAERVQRHQREMLRAEQLSAVGQLAASVAHEVRNPLTSVKLLVEAALRGRSPKPLTRDDLEVIHAEVVRLEQTVQTFLDFARLPTPRRQVLDLRDVLSQAVELVRARARQQTIEIRVRAPDQPVPADVDASQLSTVLVNLFLNALDAMPHGGSLEIRLAAPPGGDIRLEVADTGSGIAAEIASRLFTPFASSKPTGTGLGLSISRRIVEEHGGCIGAANRPQGGACFTITLPAVKEEVLTV